MEDVKKEREKMVWEIVLTIAAVLAVFLIWIMIYDTTHFETTVYKISDERIRGPFRAAVLADLHNQQYGRDNRILLEAVKDGKPDVILIAGDIPTARPGASLEPALHFVEALAKDFPVCYGVGNHEHRLRLYPEDYGDMAKRYESGLAGFGVEEMINTRRNFEELGISVVGSQIGKEYYKRFQKIKMENSYLEQLLGNPERDKYTILLAHNPDYFPQYASWGADLVLAGHVHGGVARIPFWKKGVVSPKFRLFPEYDGGEFREGKSRMILSRGLGSHTIPFRLFNPGDLIFIDFSSGLEEGKGSN